MTHDRQVGLVFLAACGVLLVIAVIVAVSIYTQRSWSIGESLEIESPPEGEFIEIAPVDGEALEKPEWVLRGRTVHGVVRAIIPITDRYNCGHYAVMVETGEGPEKALFNYLPILYPGMEVRIEVYSYQLSEPARSNETFMWGGSAIVDVCDFVPWDERAGNWREIR